jgi:hypothetical protein
MLSTKYIESGHWGVQSAPGTEVQSVPAMKSSAPDFVVKSTPGLETSQQSAPKFSPPHGIRARHRHRRAVGTERFTSWLAYPRRSALQRTRGVRLSQPAALYPWEIYAHRPATGNKKVSSQTKYGLFHNKIKLLNRKILLNFFYTALHILRLIQSEQK